jgi:hypothetical protein
MAHHAFFVAGGREEGIQAALAFAERELGMPLTGNPDIIIERYGLFSVDDARRVAAKASLAPLRGSEKLYVIAANRIFHEAQNAMLKLFEEPPAGTTLIMVLPSEGDLIYTLRSRLLPLPESGERAQVLEEEVQAFAVGGAAAREKIVEKILDDAKSDDDEEKQEARARALRLAEGLSRAGYVAWRREAGPDSRDAMQSFLTDLDRLIPILHDRAAPLKPILEHILIIAPKFPKL